MRRTNQVMANTQLNSQAMALRKRLGGKRVRTLSVAAIAAVAGLGAIGSLAQADNVTWVGTTNLWSTTSNWSTSAVPGAGNTAVFTTSGNNTPTLTGNQSIGGIIFQSTGTEQIKSNNPVDSLTVGGGGITVNSGTGNVTLGNTATGQHINMVISGNQTWTNNSSSLFYEENGSTLTNASNATPVTLIVDTNGSGNTSLTGAISDNTPSGQTALVFNTTGTGVAQLWGNNSFSGGVVVNSGTLSAGNYSNCFGNGSITLGNTSGSANATLLASYVGTAANSIAVPSGSSGNTLAIEGQTGNQTFSGTLALNNNLTLAQLTATDITTFSGQITGAGNITIANGTATSVVAVTGPNSTSYTGNTTVNAGILNFGNGSLGTGSITLAGGTLQYAAAANNQDVSSRLIISGSSNVLIDVNNNAVTFGTAIGSITGGLTVSSTTAGGSLTLTGAQGYTGNTTINAGATLKLSPGASLVSGGNLKIAAAAGIFDLNNNSQTLGLASVTGGGFITNSGNATPTLTIGAGSTGAGNFTGQMNLIWNQSGSTNTALTNVSVVGNVTVNEGGSATAQITNLNNIGTLTNTGSTSSTTAISNAGGNITAVIEDSTSSEIAISYLTVNSIGTTLTNLLGVQELNVNHAITGTGNLILNNDSTLANGITLNNAPNFLGNITNSGTGTGTETITGNITGNVSGVMQNSATSALAINGANAFTGNLTIISGNVSSSSNTTPFGSGTGSIVLGNATPGSNNNAKLLYTGTSTTIANPIVVNAGSSGTLSIQSQTNGNTYTGNMTLNNNLLLTNLTAGKTLAFSGPITGGGNITVTNSYTSALVAITGLNSSTYTGNTTLNTGTLSVGTGSLGTGTFTFGGTSTLQWNGTNTDDLSGKLQPLTGSTIATLDLQTNNVAFATANGLTGPSTASYTKSNSAGNLTLNAANSFSGTYNSGTTGNSTIVGNSNALQNATVAVGGNYAVTFANGLGLANFGGLTGNGNLNLLDTGANALNLAVGSNNGNSTYSGVLGGSGSFAKVGSGTLTLAGASTYSGATTVNGGTLNVTAATNGLPAASNVANNAALQLAGAQTLGTISGNGTTTVNASGNLTVNGFTQAALVNNGLAAINGNAAIGQLTGSGNLTIGTGSSNNTMQLTPNALPNSFTHTQQAVTISSGSTLDITNNTLLLNYGNGSTPLAVVQAAVASGALTSSTVATGNPGQYAIGYADTTEIASIASGNVEVMFTLGGDCNLDGTANFNDYSILQNNYNQTGRDWSQGDFNHDGAVNFNDYSILQNNYNQSLAGAIADSSIDNQGITVAVPEPASVGLFLLGSLPLVARRRRR